MERSENVRKFQKVKKRENKKRILGLKFGWSLSRGWATTAYVYVLFIYFFPKKQKNILQLINS